MRVEEIYMAAPAEGITVALSRMIRGDKKTEKCILGVTLRKHVSFTHDTCPVPWYRLYTMHRKSEDICSMVNNGTAATVLHSSSVWSNRDHEYLRFMLFGTHTESCAGLEN
jgi:hypothetical protein